MTGKTLLYYTLGFPSFVLHTPCRLMTRFFNTRSYQHVVKSMHMLQDGRITCFPVRKEVYPWRARGGLNKAFYGAYEEVITDKGGKEQQDLQCSRTRGLSTFKMPGKKICIVGSGNWGSSIAKIIGHNVKASNRFDPMVNMWVYEEIIDGKKLTEIINTDHENVKYLPGHKLPRNVVAVPDIIEAVKGAKILVFVIPHQFISKLCDQIKPHITEGTIGISLIKGIDEGPDGLKLISDIIREKLEIEVSVLMGANIASEVADEKFCETTIGSTNEANGQIFKEMLQTPNFRITVVPESDIVELCGALKNIVAVGAGFCDGLGFGDNTKAAVIRLGLMEMVAFARLFCKGQVSSGTFLESCGVADLITTCYGGRNRKVAEAFVKTSKSIVELEAEMLNGQKLQGPQTSAEVYKLLQKRDMVSKFPLFAAVYQICFEGKEVKEFITCLQNHPEHM